MSGGIGDVDQVAGGAPIVTMTQTEFGRHRGITQQAVSKAIAEGRIPQSALTTEGRIDVAAAEIALDGATLRLDEPMPTAAAPETSPPETAALTRARRETEELNHRRLELLLGRQEGLLLEIEDVRHAAELATDSLVGQLERLPFIADDLFAAASSGGVAALRAMLEDKIDGIRRHLARNMAGLAAGRVEGTQ